MANFKELFSNRHAVLPVVHVETSRQMLKNIEIAEGEGADGVFVISMRRMNHSDLLKMQTLAKSEFSSFWIGVNYLDLDASSVFQFLNYKVDGVWVDNAQIEENVDIQAKALSIQASRERSRWNGLYFGGVAFKYQDKVNDYALAAKIASKTK